MPVLTCSTCNDGDPENEQQQHIGGKEYPMRYEIFDARIERRCVSSREQHAQRAAHLSSLTILVRHRLLLFLL